MPVDTPGHVPTKGAAIEAARAGEPGGYLMEVMIRSIREAGAKRLPRRNRALVDPRGQWQASVGKVAR